MRNPLVRRLMRSGQGGVTVSLPDAAFAFVPFPIKRHGNVFAPASSWNIANRAGVTVLKRYYLNTVTGSDSNSGLTPLLPKKTWNNIIGLGDADEIFIQTGSYLIRAESGLVPNRNTRVIGEGTVKFTSNNNEKILAFSLTAGRTFTFEAQTSSEFVASLYDENTLDAFGNPTRYIPVASIAEVEALAGSFFWENGSPRKVYVHTLNGLTPTGQTGLKFYDSSALFWKKDNLRIYIENIQFIGGVTFQNNSSLGVGTKAYMYNCRGTSIGVAGVSEFIAQNVILSGSNSDGINYDPLNTLPTNAIEINCEIYGAGNLGNDQPTTSHSGCPIVRVMGKYHDMPGQCMAEAGTTTKAWVLGSELYQSLIAQVGYYTEGITYLDRAYIHNVASDLQANGVNSRIYTRKIRSGGVNIGTGIISTY